MPNTPIDISALIGSRICHDLISPIGAIGNGVELLSMLDGVDGPEMALITESVRNANAKIRFFRIAFGIANADQMVSTSEIITILQDIGHARRISIDWAINTDIPRPQVRLVFLLLQCLESAMPYGGAVTVERDNGRWTIHAVSEKMKIDQANWEMVVSTHIAPEIRPSDVHFALVPDAAQQAKRTLNTSLTNSEITLVF